MSEPGHTDQEKRGLAKRTHEFMMELGMKDPMTGLSNKRALETEWKRSHSLFRRNELKYKFIFMDLDKFKPINDIDQSHKLGDEILRKVADTLKLMMRPEDIVARVGGDEFAAILEGDNVENNEQIQSKFEDRFRIKFREIASEEMFNEYPQLQNLSISVGVVDPESEDTFDTIYERGDKLMYSRKEAKKVTRK